MASVRFICGTQELHKQLESAISRFFGKDDAILYSSCWDANGGLFETILGEDDAVISDERHDMAKKAGTARDQPNRSPGTTSRSSQWSGIRKRSILVSFGRWKRSRMPSYPSVIQ